MIPGQEITTYYNNIKDKVFIFCVKDNEYKDVYAFISENNLFEMIPPSNTTIQIKNPNTSLCLVDDIPAVHYFEQFK